MIPDLELHNDDRWGFEYTYGDLLMIDAGFCGCVTHCGDDDGDIDGPGTCKALPIKREPLIEIVMVPRGSNAQ
jgi:hypothetical protein